MKEGFSFSKKNITQTMEIYFLRKQGYPVIKITVNENIRVQLNLY